MASLSGVATLLSIAEHGSGRVTSDWVVSGPEAVMRFGDPAAAGDYAGEVEELGYSAVWILAQAICFGE